MSIQRCMECGYCSPDIQILLPGVAEIINTQIYRARLNDATYPESGNNFFCWAMIQEQLGCYNLAAQAMISAAWICDDDIQFRTVAIDLRAEALRLLDCATAAGQIIQDSPGYDIALRIDLLRRCNRFDEASELCKHNPGLNGFLQKIIRYQHSLISRKDFRRHMLSEVPDNDV